MGFLVDVQWIAIPIAVCGESDCDWTGTYGLTEREARSEAEAHWRWHADEWERRNEEWERDERNGMASDRPEGGTGERQDGPPGRHSRED